LEQRERKITPVHNGEEKYKWDPKRGEAIRPYRLYSQSSKINLIGRAYKSLFRAHTAAMIECRFKPIGVAIQIYDVRNEKDMGTYIHRPTGWGYLGPETKTLVQSKNK
jgi:hypothetical protein